ncbi:MAG: discoidin domain-containing protein, partial [bacterium]|nr:discoidin domain-containing protein [bacterium]
MRATTGSDVSGPVEYYFDETSGENGGTDSGWVTNPVYNDTGLDPSTQYTYTVQMRDSASNTGTASSPANATTYAPKIASGALTATASTQFSDDRGPAYVVDGSGMTGLAHSNGHPDGQMWLDNEQTPQWFKVDLGVSYYVDKMVVYNFNWSGYTNRGCKNVEVFYSN